MGKKKETPLERAGRLHIDALERLANADDIKAKQSALAYAVDTFDAFIAAIPTRRGGQ